MSRTGECPEEKQRLWANVSDSLSAHPAWACRGKRGRRCSTARIRYTVHPAMPSRRQLHFLAKLHGHIAMIPPAESWMPAWGEEGLNKGQTQGHRDGKAGGRWAVRCGGDMTVSSVEPSPFILYLRMEEAGLWCAVV